jgi:hypothetical protein
MPSAKAVKKPADPRQKLIEHGLQFYDAKAAGPPPLRPSPARRVPPRSNDEPAAGEFRHLHSLCLESRVYHVLTAQNQKSIVLNS